MTIHCWRCMKRSVAVLEDLCGECRKSRERSGERSGRTSDRTEADHRARQSDLTPATLNAFPELAQMSAIADPKVRRVFVESETEEQRLLRELADQILTEAGDDV